MRLQELGINKGQVMAISKEEESDEEVLLVKNETETVYVLKRHIKIKNECDWSACWIHLWTF